MKNIIVLHEYGAPEHFVGLQQFVSKNNTKFKLSFIEFRILKNIAKGILKNDKIKIIKNIKNFFSIISLLLSENEIVILGMAPYDGFVLIANLIKKRNYIVYYSSWPYWDYSEYPKKVWFMKKYVERKWMEFTKNVRFVGVTKTGVCNFSVSNNCKRSWIIPHSFNQSIFYPYNKLESDKTLKVIKVIFVGRIVPEKGINYILDAILSQALNGDFVFSFVGDGDEDLVCRLKKMEALYSNIKYLGRIDDSKTLASIYRESDIILLPSFKTTKWEELFGMVLIEAMACGVVPIATDCIGPKSIITNGKDGFIIQQKSSMSIIKALNTCVENKGLLKKMSDNAIDTAQEYTIDNCSDKWANVIYDIVNDEEI